MRISKGELISFCLILSIFVISVRYIVRYVGGVDLMEYVASMTYHLSFLDIRIETFVVMSVMFAFLLWYFSNSYNMSRKIFLSVLIVLCVFSFNLMDIVRFASGIDMLTNTNLEHYGYENVFYWMYVLLLFSGVILLLFNDIKENLYIKNGRLYTRKKLEFLKGLNEEAKVDSKDSK